MFKVVDVGLYDSIYECTVCGFKYMDSVDAPKKENEERAIHDCETRQKQP